MRQLEKITISNVRRFSQNVEISVGKGATVFLAPNGTGKTAIFEAIELALTGRVKRLPFPPDALIRDSKNDSKIRLDFDSGKFCEAEFMKGRDPILRGDHNDIFAGLPTNDVAFLLRLTHLLNQRGSDWLVQSQSDVAADQLDHLAIGKDALRVNDLIPSAKRQANIVLDAANRQLEEVKKALDVWQNLQGRREQNKNQIASSTLPLDELLLKLNKIGEKLDVAPIATDSIDAVIGQHAVIQRLLEKQNESNQQNLVSANLGDQLITEYTEIQRLLKEANEDLTKTKGSKKEIAKEISNLQEKFIQRTNELRTQEEALVRITTLNQQTALLNDTIKEISRLEGQIKETLETLQKAQGLRTQLNDQYDNRKRIWNLSQAFREKSTRIAEDRAAVLSNSNSIEKWKTLILQIDALRSKSQGLESDVASAQRELANATKNLDEARQATNIIQRNFESLSSSADDIKNAVSIIAARISPEATECPVCLHSYPEGELQTQVMKALENIDPILKQTANLLEIERNKIAELISISDNTKSAYSSTKRLSDENREEIERLSIELTKNYISVVYNAASLQEAITLLAEAQKTLSVQEKELDELGDQLKLETVEPLGPIEERLQQSTNDILGLNEKLGELNRKNAELNSTLAAVKLFLETQDKIDGLEQKIAEQENFVSHSKDNLDILTKSQENQQRLLNQTNAILDGQEDTSSRLATRLSNTITRWQGIGQKGTPDRSLLQELRNSIEKAISIVSSDLAELKSIAEELLKLKTYEEHFQVEREVALIKGEKSEVDYEKDLKERLAKANQKIVDFNRKTSTLTLLANNIAAQLDNINERISSINPLWGKLLKRIVLDPRFAETKLVSYTHYRKQHADVNVTLHGQDYVVAQIASEAQITDLQFTFLLAMAQKYQWSPWRALLLDDPTQHHDLVHASAVFDLLRDYIMDQHFQVLLATHDSTHANFFVRKLENDGIPTKLWKLDVTADGVNAVLS